MTAPSSTLARRAAALACMPFTRAVSSALPGIRILMYHRVVPLPAFDQLSVHPDRFAAHMAYLSKNCDVLSLAQAVRSMDESNLQSGSRPKIVVTFDDGYRDNLLHAFPILSKYRLPATIFVTTGFCDQSISHPRYLRTQDRLHLDWAEVRELASSDLITIGSHTITHPYLSRVSSDQAETEIMQSRVRIESEINRKVGFFCYPSGDVTSREMAISKQAGYQASVTVAPGLNRSGTLRHLLRRTEITDRDTPSDLAMKIAGAYDPLHALLHYRRRHKFAAASRIAQTTQEHAG
jgi:peptidoglycan/xylan/chitin deacetylase (PgdA/CDA1 family)